MAYPFNSAQRKQSLGRWRGRVRRLATGFRQIPIRMATRSVSFTEGHLVGDLR